MSALSARKGNEAVALAPWGLEPRRLGSFWEVHKFYAERLIQVTAKLAHLNQSMMSSEQLSKAGTDPMFKMDDFRTIEGIITELKDQLLGLDLSMSVLSADHLISVFVKLREDSTHKHVVVFPERTSLAVRGFINDLSRSIQNEMTMRTYLSITIKEADYYSPKVPLFGDDAANKFPGLQYDIAESGKCLALGRSTASVFHSLRSLEGAIHALRRCLGLPDPVKGIDRSWGNLLGSLSGRIDEKWKKNTMDRHSKECKFFQDAHAALAAMMNPWRNETMHLESVYTQEDAQDIFESVRSFMKKIASQMDEQGDPKV